VGSYGTGRSSSCGGWEFDHLNIARHFSLEYDLDVNLNLARFNEKYSLYRAVITELSLYWNGPEKPSIFI
jgi:hypothetical protein